MQGQADVLCRGSLMEVIGECIRAKGLSNLRSCYVRELSRVLGKFSIGRQTKQISEISVAEIDEWIGVNSATPGTRATLITRLSALFGFAVRRGYINFNPMIRIDRVRIDRSPPRVLSPDEAHGLIQATASESPQLLAMVTLGLYCGLRPAEIQRLDWSSIDTARGFVKIDSAASKVRRRRVVPIPDVAKPFLNKKSGPVAPRYPLRPRRKVERRMGWKNWPHDVLRHTCASYLLALHQDPARVAFWLGNSPGILLRHYYEIVGPDECQAFWKCRS